MLDALVAESRGRNLFFSTEIDRGIREARIIFIAQGPGSTCGGATRVARTAAAVNRPDLPAALRQRVRAAEGYGRLWG